MTLRDPKEYLYSNFQINQATGCWDWTGRVFSGGYGEFKCKAIKRGNINASRASWIIHNGPLADRKILVCHTCDNRKCVNPDHLFLGSSSDNMMDASRKGRINRGEGRPQSKLTEDSVRLIREERATGVPYNKIAARYGVNTSAIFCACTRKTWAHVT